MSSKMIYDIRECNISDYNDAINTYISLITKSNDVLAILQIGSINTLGISDIDFVIVLKNNLENFNHSEYSINILPEKDRYLFMHEPFITPVCFLDSIYIIFPINEINTLYIRDGFEMPLMKKRSDEGEEFFFLNYLLRGYYFRSNFKSLRLFLAVASLTRYTASLLENVTKKNIPKDVKKKIGYIVSVKKNHSKCNENDFNHSKYLFNETNYFFVEFYTEFLLTNYNNSNFTISTQFFPRIIIFLPIKKIYGLKFIVFYPYSIYQRYNDDIFSELFFTINLYNKWIYENNLYDFSIFSIIYKDCRLLLKKLLAKVRIFY